MSLEYSTLFLYTVGIIFLFFLGRVFSEPMKIVVKILGKCTLGGIVIVILNLVGKVLNFYIALNPITSLLVGTLGMPGICLTVALQYILNK